MEQQCNDYRVIIAGGRNFKDYLLLREKCDFHLGNKMKDCHIIVLSGTAKGADTMGELYASERGFQLEKHPANWRIHGKAAGMVRNKEMAENANALIAFWDGRSPGTKNMIEIARKHGLRVMVINY